MQEKSKELTFLIMSGPTREYIDPVRFISNESSGKMGAALANYALKKKHKVIFISGPADFYPSKKANIINIISAQDMYKQLKKYFKEADIIIGAAAVADFKPAKTNKHKIKKEESDLIIKLKKNPDIIAYCGKNKKNQIVAGFALETKNIIENAEKKMINKDLDMIIANGKESLGADKTDIIIMSKYNKEDIVLKDLDKNKIAEKIIDETIRIFKNTKTCKKIS